MLNLFLTIFTLILLILASNWVLDGAIGIAKRFKLSPLVIGSTIVAFGTILPSVAVNIAMVLINPNSIDIAVGNMLGTNYVNLGLALGIPAFITTIITKYNVFEKEIPIYLCITALLTTFTLDSQISQLEGAFLLISYLLVAIVIYQYAKREKKEDIKHEDMNIDNTEEKNIYTYTFKVIGGIIILVVSSFVLTYSGPLLAKDFGISEYILGLTLIGIGTSLPTIVASIQAARKGYIDIILGNVFGGNIINIGIGVGLPAIFHTLSFNPNSLADIYFTNIYNFIILIAILIEMRLLGGNKSLSKISGILIVSIYLLYLLSKILL